MAASAIGLGPSRAQRTLGICGVVVLHLAFFLSRAPQHTRLIPEQHVVPEMGKLFVALEPARIPKPSAPRKSAPPGGGMHVVEHPPAVQPHAVDDRLPLNALADRAGADTAPASAPAPAAPPAAATPLVSNSPDLSTSDADYSRNPPPPYPAASRRLREQGQVLLSVLVSPEGTVKDAAVENSSGYARLDQAALDAVRDWVFIPAKRAGVAVLSRVKVPVNFVLR